MNKEAPENLSDEARIHWKQIVEEYDVDDAVGLMVLARALESFDRMRQAQAVIKEKGIIFEDKFGQLKNNPATTCERDSRSGMLQALKQLNIDIEIVPSRTGRPPGR